MRQLLYIFLFIIGVLQIANAYDPVQNVEDNWQGSLSQELSDRKAHDSAIDEDVEVAGDGEEKAYSKTWEENRAGKVQAEEKFYTIPASAQCENPNDYVCPPLVEEKIKLGFRSRINYIDLESGKISCSILRPLKNKFTPSTIKSEIPYHTEIFTNKKCVEKYSPKSPQNQKYNEKTEELIEENKQFLKDLKQQEYKYTVDYKYNGDDEFLDLADILDGIVSFNSNMFDFEQTLLTRDLKVRDGFTTLPNETIVQKLEESWGNLKNLFRADYSQDDFYDNQKNQAKIRDVSAAIANSNFFMLLDFWLKSNDVMVLMAQGIALLFVSYNVLFTWIMPSVSNKIQKQPSGENNPHRIGLGVLALIMLFSGEVERLDIEYESKTQDITTSELIVQQTNIQHAIQFLYSETNHWADVFAEVGISSYLSNLTASTGLFTDEQIEALASEQIILNNAFASYREIDAEMCFNNYDVELLKGLLDTYRNKTLNKNSGTNILGGASSQISVGALFGGDGSGVSELRVNPFPKSESEANWMMFGKRDTQLYNNISPYNTAASLYNGGVVDNSVITKFRDSFHSPLSLSGCYLNRKKMTETRSRLGEIQKQFDKLGDKTKKDAKVEYLKVIHDIQWGLFAKQGYISIAYLPATAMLIDNIGIIGDGSERADTLESATGGDNDGLGTQGFRMVAEDMVYLSMFGGYQIAKMIHPVKDFIVEGVENGLFLTGGPILKAVKGASNLIKKAKVTFSSEEDVDILDLKIAAFFLKNALEVLIVITLIVGSILIFTLLFIEKLFAFVASMFLLIYAFSKNQEERITSAIAKIFAVAFKTILIVVCIFLSLYSLDLVTSLEIIFVESFFTSMDSIENASWNAIFDGDFGGNGPSNILSMITLFFQKYIFYGVAKVAFVMLKLVLVVQMIWKMPGFMYELMYEKINSVSDSVGDTLQSVNERQTMKI